MFIQPVIIPKPTIIYLPKNHGLNNSKNGDNNKYKKSFSNKFYKPSSKWHNIEKNQ